MGIRAVDNFDSTFELSQDSRSSLVELLSTETFCQQVSNIWCALQGLVLSFGLQPLHPRVWQRI
jgi:hypothetical protein